MTGTFPSVFLPVKCSQTQESPKVSFLCVLHVLKVAMHNLELFFIQLEL